MEQEGGRTFNEKLLFVLVTTLTNFVGTPATVVVWRKRLYFEFWIAWFTVGTSFMYHLCDSIEHGMWLSEGEWHRLDNIGSIACMCTYFIYMIDFQDRGNRELANFFMLGVVILLQEKAPWDERFTLYPILVSILVWLCTLAYWRQWHHYHWGNLTKGFALLFLAACCFVRGLDDPTDPYRFFHGCWHCLVACASYYLWQVLPTPAYVLPLSSSSSLELGSSSDANRPVHNMTPTLKVL